jgi:hypothetical protein
MSKRVFIFLGGFGIIAVGAAFCWLGLHQFLSLSAAEVAGTVQKPSPTIVNLVYMLLGKWGVLVGYAFLALACFIHGGVTAWDSARDETPAA